MNVNEWLIRNKVVERILIAMFVYFVWHSWGMVSDGGMDEGQTQVVTALFAGFVFIVKFLMDDSRKHNEK